MRRIRELIVVEGKHDVQKLKRLFDCDTVITNGLSLDERTMELIRSAADRQGVIILTDPDNPGEVIRKAIMEIAPQAKHVFIKKKDAIGKRNVGVEYADDEALIEALDNWVVFDQRSESISWQQFRDLNIIGNKRSREDVCEHFHIGYSNNKTLFKRLNMLGITAEEVRRFLNEGNDSEH